MDSCTIIMTDDSHDMVYHRGIKEDMEEVTTLGVPSELFSSTPKFSLQSPNSSSSSDSSFQDFADALENDFYVPPVGLFRSSQLPGRDGRNSGEGLVHLSGSLRNVQTEGPKLLQEELESLKEALKLANRSLDAERVNAELHRRELMETREKYARCKSELEDYTIKYATASNNLQAEIALRRENNEKALQYDTLKTENEFYKKEIEALRAGLTENLSILKVLQQNEKSKTMKLDSAEKELEKVLFEKISLQKDLDDVCISKENMKYLHAEANERCKKLEEQVEDLTRRLGAVQSSCELKFDGKMKEEMIELRLMVEREVEVSISQWVFDFTHSSLFPLNNTNPNDDDRFLERPLKQNGIVRVEPYVKKF